MHLLQTVHPGQAQSRSTPLAFGLNNNTATNTSTAVAKILSGYKPTKLLIVLIGFPKGSLDDPVVRATTGCYAVELARKQQLPCNLQQLLTFNHSTAHVTGPALTDSLAARDRAEGLGGALQGLCTYMGEHKAGRPIAIRQSAYDSNECVKNTLYIIDRCALDEMAMKNFNDSIDLLAPYTKGKNNCNKLSHVIEAAKDCPLVEVLDEAEPLFKVSSADKTKSSWTLSLARPPVWRYKSCSDGSDFLVQAEWDNKECFRVMLETKLPPLAIPHSRSFCLHVGVRLSKGDAWVPLFPQSVDAIVKFAGLVVFQEQSRH